MVVNLEWLVLVLVLVTAGSNQIDYSKWMVVWQILFDDGNGDVVVAPHSTQLHFTPSPTTCMEWNGTKVVLVGVFSLPYGIDYGNNIHTSIS
mmetsp:Transcript_20453/g.21903  ORF Transcript_20453/g.21903 Transcript_20453/m.21903 type:complete len:92 (+) Transcript_20453:952-1227(+)